MELDRYVSWRTMQRVDARQTAVAQAASFVPLDALTHKEKKILFDLNQQDRKRKARVTNVNNARSTGVHTNSGSHYKGGSSR